MSAKLGSSVVAMIRAAADNPNLAGAIIEASSHRSRVSTHSFEQGRL